ncbi:MAG: NmrA family NAD(P)-binding protein [Gammaproteobacteria bacterium]
MAETLIIGASGNIGAHVTKHYVDRRGAGSLRLMSSRADGCIKLRDDFPGAEIFEASLYDLESLLPVVEHVERIFMNVPDMLDERRATPNLIAALQQTGVNPHILRFCAYPPHKGFKDLTAITQASGIGAAKHYIAKEALLNSPFATTFLNAPCWFMTNLAWLSADAVREQQCLNIPHPHETPWISPNDIGEAGAELLLRDANTVEEEYIITGPEVLDFASVAALMSSTFGRQIRYDSDVEIFRRYFGDMTESMVEYFAHSKIDYGSIEPTSTLREILGRPPETLAAWLKDNRAAFAI